MRVTTSNNVAACETADARTNLRAAVGDLLRQGAEIDCPIVKYHLWCAYEALEAKVSAEK